MTKKLTSDFKADIYENNLPLILHFALLHEEGDELSGLEMMNKSNVNKKRYGTHRYLPGNKFFKPISRTLDA